MFINYKKIYKSIIEKRLCKKPLDKYTEKHHIIPKSLGGSDDNSNLVRLTAREHFLCHYLLTKIYNKESNEWYKMNHAFMIMKSSSLKQKRYFNSRLYENLRHNFSKVMSKSQSGKNNSCYGTMWITNNLENKKIHKDNEIPIGWKKGRKLINKKSDNSNKIELYTKLVNVFNKDCVWYVLQKEYNLDITYKRFRTLARQYSTIPIKKSNNLMISNVKYETLEEYNKAFNKISKYYTELYLVYKENSYKDFVRLTSCDEDNGNLIKKFKTYVDDYISGK